MISAEAGEGESPASLSPATMAAYSSVSEDLKSEVSAGEGLNLDPASASALLCYQLLFWKPLFLHQKNKPPTPTVEAWILEDD